MGTIYLGEFSIVLHDPILDLTLLQWHLKVPKRREASVQPFFCNVHILLQWGNGMGTSYLVFECSKEKRGPQPLFHYIYTCSQAPACEG
ncbi:hypothetical protein L208DRAFT_168498 [Tricholoma matsutake]|nr:hypothetical protein L208DRAFT_168498 [Tricholoma matsutake 945]